MEKQHSKVSLQTLVAEIYENDPAASYEDVEQYVISRLGISNEELLTKSDYTSMVSDDALQVVTELQQIGPLVISCTDKQESTSFDDQSVFLAEYDVDSIHITYSKGTSFTKSSDRDYITVTASDDNNYCQIVVDRVECKDGVVYSNHYDCNGNLLATYTFIDDELVDIFIDEEIDYSFEPETKGRRNGGSFVSCFAKVYNENREFLNSEESGLAGILCDAPGISTICHAANAIVSTLLCVF